MLRHWIGLLTLALALLAAGCGSSNPKLLAQTDADKLNAAVDQIQQACDSGNAGAVSQRTQAARDLIDGLPRRVDKQLKQNMNDWLDHIDKRAGATAAGLADGDAERHETRRRPRPRRRRPPRRPTPTATDDPDAHATATPTPSATPPRRPTPAAGRRRRRGNGGSGGSQGPGRPPAGSGDAMTTDQLFAGRYDSRAASASAACRPSGSRSTRGSSATSP